MCVCREAGEGGWGWGGGGLAEVGGGEGGGGVGGGGGGVLADVGMQCKRDSLQIFSLSAKMPCLTITKKQTNKTKSK